MTASLGEDLRRTPGLTLRPVVFQRDAMGGFVDQWDPKSPWHDRRVRLAANLRIDRQAIQQAETLDTHCSRTRSFPNTFDYFWAPPPPQYDRARAKSSWPRPDIRTDWTPVTTRSMPRPWPSVNGRPTRSRPRHSREARPRARRIPEGLCEKKYRNLVPKRERRLGNGRDADRSFIAAGGAYVYGSYPDIDGLFPRTGVELDKKRRERRCTASSS